MTDPFDALRMPVTPADPDPSFATRLRARLERALTLPQGVSVSTSTVDVSRTAAPAALGAAIPYLAVSDGRRAIDWYVDVFGAQIIGEPIVMADGRIGHCELALSGGTLYLAEEFPEIGFVAPSAGPTSVNLMLAVPDVDAVLAAALTAGGTSDREPYDGYGQRNAYVTDPFGHRWGLHSDPRPEPAAARHGDLTYASLWVPDADRAADFYADVLGWTYHPGGGNARQVRDTTPALGIFGGHRQPTLFCCYAVTDLDAALERVRAGGGSTEPPRDEPYGRTADCTDDQGIPFALNEVSGTGRTAPSGTEQGDIAYLTLSVADSGKTRDFYGAVLGWEFSPGNVADGWQVTDTTPAIGLAGGSDQPAGIPMWRVDDIAGAVVRVRSAGGTATEAQQQPYGLMSECVDDQGSRFFLGELPG
ncbi:MAG: glyoxalase [Geodermatophilaceae bacterium]|nr:glyoxalase [Geodermatophilaceae bacterium]